MNFRRTLRNTLLAGALALGFGSTANADTPAPNINKLPVNAVSLVPRTVTRHVVDEQENLSLYVTKLGGDTKQLVAIESNDPAVTIGRPYRVPIGKKDLIEIDRETNDSRYRNDISRSLTAPELIGIGSDYQIWSEELPSDFKEGTFNYWTAARCWDPLQHYERQCASVAFPISVYRVEDSTPDVERNQLPSTQFGENGVPFEVHVITANPPQCSDGEDNDKDGLIDYPLDPGCRSEEDKNERKGLFDFFRKSRARAATRTPAHVDIEPLPVHRELTALIGGGVDQYTASDSVGTNYPSIDFDTKSAAVRFRTLGEKTKIDLQGAITMGNDKAGNSLRALDAELHADYKLFRSNVSPGISAAIGVKDVRTYTDFWGEDSRQGNGYGFLGLNLTATGNGGFASQNFAVLRAGVVAQPIIDKKLSFGNSSYESTTDMELAYPEISLDVRKSWTKNTDSWTDNLYTDVQARWASDVETIYKSSNTNRELTNASEYLNLTLGLGYQGQSLGAYLQGKWAHNGEMWSNIGTPTHPNTLTPDHNSLGVRAGITWMLDTN